MTERNRDQVFLEGRASAEAFSGRGGGGTLGPIKGENRAERAARLLGGLSAACAEARSLRDASHVQIKGAKPGTYLRLKDEPSRPLDLMKAEYLPSGIRLVAATGEGETRSAVVFVPEGKEERLEKKLDEYATKETKKGKPRHFLWAESLKEIGRGTIRDIWTDKPEDFPGLGRAIWWEIWLRADGGEEVRRFRAFAKRADLPVSQATLHFHDRTVCLTSATTAQLQPALYELSDLAETRLARVLSSDFTTLTAPEQLEWVEELMERVSLPSPHAPAACILDTGVNRGHPLLSPILAEDDVLSIKAMWGSHDHHPEGHGTGMAGLAAYGDLLPLLDSGAPVDLPHHLESVKILPPADRAPTEPRLYGAVTAQGVALAEINKPKRPRSFILSATTGAGEHLGQPSAWSAAIDALAFGRSFDPSEDGLRYLDEPEGAVPRLLLLAGGTIHDPTADPSHTTHCDLHLIRAPAQAWNALTVGGCTDLDRLDPNDPDLKGWTALAGQGELSPWSTTGVLSAKVWPQKPDVVAEAGNAAAPRGASQGCQVPSLSVLTTHHDLPARPLGTFWGTSAAVSEVGRIATSLMAYYPRYWPETVRALVIHSAAWSGPMEAERNGLGSSKARRENFVRRYGMGIPNLERAARCATNALTIVAQETIHPFDKGKLREMHLHELPWPTAELRDLGATQVTLRVTLSYFIEPNPGRRGWTKRHSYASHGLRFRVRSATESTVNFRKRINKAALAEKERKPATEPDPDWWLGKTARDRGSVHSDIWQGTAAELADRGVIAVYPVTGWWKEVRKRDQSERGVRYALVVSIETAEVDCDIWTPVATQVGIQIET